MFTKNAKRYLMLLAALGLIAIAAGSSGTFASFDAEVTNSGNTFASGTLFLHDTPNGGTTCTSESDLTNNHGSNSCTILFDNLDLQDGAQTATIALKNAGTINSSDLKFKVANCSVGDNSANTSSSTVFGTAPTCSDMWLTVQETGNTFAVPGTDVYCAFGATTTPPNCDAPSAASSLATPAAFTQLKTTGAANATLTAGQTRYYVITVAPNVSSGNALQNRQVSFDMSWLIDQ